MSSPFQKIVSVTLTVFIFSSVFAQISPGGIGTANLTAWLRADDLPSGNVTSWSTQYPNGANTITLTENAAPYPQLESTPSDAVSNYNRTIHFSNNSYIGLNPINLQGLALTPAPNLLDNAYSNNQGSFFSAYYLPQPISGNGHMLLYNEGNDAIQFRNLTNKGRIALGLLPTNSTNASRDWNEDFKPNITSYKGNRSAISTMKGYNKGTLLSTPITASQSSGSNGLYIGYAPTIGTSAYNGYVHEFIFFNRDLTDIEMSKVHAYLSVKYGVTLDNSGGGTNGDYISTNGSLIWDASLNPAYHNDVIGIGRDDVEGLNQKQSHSFDDSIRIYISSLEASNELNDGVITSNNSYLIMGRNNGQVCGTLNASVEVPIGITNRIEREFKVTKSNFSQIFNWDIKMDTCSGFLNNINTENLRLLVDDDGNFSNAQIYDQIDGITFSQSNGTISVSNISDLHIPNNTTRYITIAYVDISFSLTHQSPVCFGDEGWMVFSIHNTNTPIDINYSIGTNNLVLNQISDGDTIYFSQNQTTTYLFSPIPSPLSCCGTSSGSNTSVTLITPPPIGISISPDTTICQNGTVSLYAQASEVNCEYHWNFTTDLSDHQTDTPATDAQYAVYATNASGCTSDTASTLVFLLSPLQGFISPDQTICPGYPTQIDINSISGGIPPYDISWSNGQSGQGNNMQIEVNPPQTSQYTVIVTDACESSPVNYIYNITVAPLPTPLIATPSTTACNPGSFYITNETDPTMVQSILWKISDGQIFNSNQEINLTDLPTGQYDIQLIVTSPQGCIDSATFSQYIEVYPSPIANFSWSPNPIQMFNTEVQFQNLSQLGHNYEWYFEEGSVNYSNQMEPTVTFPDGETGHYEVILYTTSEYGCTDSITKILNVEPEVLLYAPNSFTPDGDEFNQLWHVYIEGIDVYDFHLSIYDRWGQTVWESNNPETGWDGTAFGESLQSGTYIWALTAGDALNDSRYTWHGSVNIIR